MKKYLITILLLVIIIPFVVKAKSCDNNKIYINSISLENKSDGVSELEEANVDGEDINLNLEMTNVEDNIQYKVIVNNDSEEDYELDKNDFNVSSDYIELSFKSEDNSNTIKASSSKTFHLNIEYKNEIPNSGFDNGTYNYNKTMTVNMSSKNTIDIINPKTGLSFILFILIVVLLICITIFIFIKKKEYSKLMMVIIGFIILLPICVLAICKYNIDINSKIEIKRETRKICIMEDVAGTVHLLPYMKDVTWDEYYNNSSDEVKAELDFLWQYHGNERKCGFITSKCILVDGNSGYDCYVGSGYRDGPYTDEDFMNDTFYGFLPINSYILDSSKICYTYID